MFDLIQLDMSGLSVILFLVMHLMQVLAVQVFVSTSQLTLQLSHINHLKLTPTGSST